MTNYRQQRASELLFEELSILIASELEDPRLRLLEVTQVVVSPDLRSARVYVFHREDEVPEEHVLKGLRNATSFLRQELAVRCNWRVVPELYFTYDDTPERAARIDELLRQIAEERQRDGSGQPSLEEPTD